MILIIYIDLLDDIFKKFNYHDPQPLIKIFGKNILEWIIDYIDIDQFNYVVLIYNNIYYKFNIENIIFTKYNSKYINTKFYINKLNQNSNIIEAILDSLKDINNENEKILYIDTKIFFLIYLLDLWKDHNYENIAFNIQDTSLNVDGFNNFLLFKNYCNKLLNNKNIFSLNNDIQIINLINIFKYDNILFNTINLNDEDYININTPLNVRLFCNNFPRIHSINNIEMIYKKRLSFNLDDIINDNKNNIQYINYLKKIGNIIILNTSTNHLEKEKIFEILKLKNIHYDEIYFDKPIVDFYIDSKSITYNMNNIEKDLGFYNNKIEARDFNDVICKDIKTYKKISDDLSGEIYYYSNIPIDIKDIFPVMFNYDINNKWYEMENINGIPISKLYLNEELTIEELNNVIGTINRIHLCKLSSILENNINIYDNYVNKIIKRYKNYDYSRFPNSENLYNILLEKLKYYEDNNLGKKSVIHGDTVLTNILINNLGKIKLIDMRGKIDNKLSIYGDSLYDWAKLYQSLIGYDEILEDKNISKEYKNMIIKNFEKIFINLFSEEYLLYLRIITASLLFTLLPLHDNEKCFKYYNLIYSLNI
jgi:hypothetical protein